VSVTWFYYRQMYSVITDTRILFSSTIGIILQIYILLKTAGINCILCVEWNYEHACYWDIVPVGSGVNIGMPVAGVDVWYQIAWNKWNQSLTRPMDIRTYTKLKYQITSFKTSLHSEHNLFNNGRNNTMPIHIHYILKYIIL
jgi:hypothetical protein